MYPAAATRSRTPAVLAGVAVAAATGLYFVNPNTTHVPLCPLHYLTGLNCPLCGGTRAVYGLLHGQLGVALHDNLLVVLGLPLVLLFWLRWRAAEPGQPIVPRRVSVAVVGLALVFGVIRNLPIGGWLAPPA